jgi:hypothetical protein
MSIKDIILKTGSTVVAPTGGTTVAVQTQEDSGQKVVRRMDLGLSYAEDGELVFSRTNPSISKTAPNGYTQLKRRVTFKIPTVPTEGTLTTNTAEIFLSTDPSTSDVEVLLHRDYLVQVLTSPDFEAFLLSGATDD